MNTLTPQVERYEDCVADMAVLQAGHWKELYGPKGYRADAGGIIDLERAGGVALFTLRDETGVLAGYACFSVTRSPFFGMNIAVDIGYYLAPAYRGNMAMARLLRFAAETLTKNGVPRVILGHAIDNDISSLVKRAGFAPISTNYMYVKG